MLPATVIRRLEALTTISKQGKRINGLFRLMEAPILWYEAYAKIYANEGAITKGVDEITLDGFSEERVVESSPTSKTAPTVLNPPGEPTSLRKVARNAN